GGVGGVLGRKRRSKLFLQHLHTGSQLDEPSRGGVCRKRSWRRRSGRRRRRWWWGWSRSAVPARRRPCEMDRVPRRGDGIDLLLQRHHGRCGLGETFRTVEEDGDGRGRPSIRAARGVG
ncbi:unnamed protein product, partial [Pylaiella littoralis]